MKHLVNVNGHKDDDREPVVDAVCMIFPDGKVRWAPADKNRVQTILQQERDNADERMKDDRLMGGYVQCRLLKSDYDRLVEGSAVIALH